MAKGVTRKILGTGVIGAGVSAGLAAIGNAVGPIPDGAMHAAEKAAFIAQWTPTDLSHAAIAGGIIGTGIGVANRFREMKNDRAAHMADAAEKARR